MGSGVVSHQLRIPDDVARLIRSLHPTITRKVRAALQLIIEAPTCGKPLKEELAGVLSYPMGRLRILYRIAEDRTIEVVAVGPRRCIYEETYRRVTREQE
jgi:mRNA-degrading endonuclease RelE of RelBE toxin-antitoxin system